METISTNIRNAFSEPLPLQEMIRITFVTGAGKLARQKYDEGAAKAVTSTLRELGYDEDRGASAVLECAGSFKLQHDTGKNLKTVVVFPKVTGGDSSAVEDAQEGIQELSIGGGSSILPENSPEHNIAFSSMNVFERMVASKCQTWTQKKGCSQAIANIKEQLEGLEQKLMAGTPLTGPEQNFYDGCSMSSLDEKLKFVKAQMHKQVEEDGKLVADELKQLQQQVTERLSKLSEEKEQAEKEGKTKRVENLNNVIAKAEERKAKLQAITPKSPPPLKHEAEIAKLRTELAPLMDIEEGKGKLLSLKETQALGRKEELLEQIEQLEVRTTMPGVTWLNIACDSWVFIALVILNILYKTFFEKSSSRGWFEEDDAFEARVKASRDAWMAKLKQANKKKKGKPTVSSGSAWATATTHKKTAAAPKKTAAKSKPKAAGGVFAAMMMDSDSD